MDMPHTSAHQVECPWVSAAAPRLQQLNGIPRTPALLEGRDVLETQDP